MKKATIVYAKARAADRLFVPALAELGYFGMQLRVSALQYRPEDPPHVPDLLHENANES
jgi:hypothetical protein